MEVHDRPAYPRWPVVLAMLVLVALVGAFTYNLGLAQGFVESGRAVTTAPGGAVFYDYPRHWHWGWGWGPGFAFAPFLGLFWIFLMFALIRRVFWGPRWYRRHYGCWGPYDYDDWYYRRGPGGPGGQAGPGGSQGPQPPPTQL